MGASAQTRLSAAEATQLYIAAGFRIAAGQPVNRCGRPAKPRVSFVDINGDKRPEALFVDADVCYAPSGQYFAVLTKAGATWRPVASGTGQIQALPTKTAGWLDMRVTEAGCTRDHRYDGRSYLAVTDCTGRVIAGVPQQARPAPAPAPATPAAPQAGGDEAAVFRAAGFTRRGGQWRSRCEDPGTASYQPGRIQHMADVNGDGRPDAVLTEGSSFCYGNTGQGYWVVSQLANGSWKLLASGTGIVQFLDTKGAGGWPDISVGGPGFCFPVERWNGREYKLQRWEYEGKPCKPPR